MHILRVCFSFSILSSSSLWAMSLTVQVAYLIIIFPLTVFLPQFVVKFAVPLSLHWGLKVMLISIGRVTSLPLGGSVVGLPPFSLCTGVLTRHLRTYKWNWVRHVTRMNNSRMSKIMLDYRQDEDDLKVLWKRLSDEAKQVYQNLTRDGWWWR